MRDIKDNLIQLLPIWLEEQLHSMHACIHLFFHILFDRYLLDRPSVCQVSSGSGNTKRNQNAFLNSRRPQFSGSGENELSTNNCKISRLCLSSSKYCVHSAMRTLRQGCGKGLQQWRDEQNEGKTRVLLNTKKQATLAEQIAEAEAPKS